MTFDKFSESHFKNVHTYGPTPLKQNPLAFRTFFMQTTSNTIILNNYFCTTLLALYTMDYTAHLLLKILREELWGGNKELIEISPKEYHSLMNLAAKQTVAGMVAQCITDKRIKIELSPNDAAKTLLFIQSIHKQNALLNSELVALAKLLDAQKIKYIVLKGQTTAAHYPHPLARTPGDIDFFIPQKDFNKAVEVLKKEWEVSFSGSDSTHHLEFKHNEVLFEMHFEILELFCQQQKRCFDNIAISSPIAYTNINGYEIPTLDPIINIAYTFGHLWYHLLELGVGMRQLCDLATLIDAAFEKCDKNSTIEAERLNNILHEIGFHKAFCVMETVLQKYFGLKRMPIQANASVSHTEAVMRRVIRYGNFGHYGRRGDRANLSYLMRLTIERIRTFAKFYTLDKKEIRARALKELPIKVFSTLFGKQANF